MNINKKNEKDEKEHVHYYICYSKHRAIELRKKKFRIIKTEVNYKFPKYDVYFFLDTPELQNAIKEIEQERTAS